MKLRTAVCLLVLTALPVFTNSAFSQSLDWPVGPWGSAGVHVAKTGSDSEDCGTPSAPCLAITHALGLVPPNATVFVHQGTYVENSIQMKSYTRLLSVDGPLMAKIYSQDQSAVRFTDNTTDMEVDGFEIYADLNEPRSGPDRDGLVRVHDSSNVDTHGLTPVALAKEILICIEGCMPSNSLQGWHSPTLLRAWSSAMI